MKDILRYIFGGGPRNATCGSCKFYDQSACRRHPPKRVYTGSVETPGCVDATVWPVVRETSDWCGEYKKS